MKYQSTSTWDGLASQTSALYISFQAYTDTNTHLVIQIMDRYIQSHTYTKSIEVCILLSLWHTLFRSKRVYIQRHRHYLCSNIQHILQSKKAPEVCPLAQMVSLSFSHGREGRDTVGNEGICFLHQGNVQQGVLLCTIHNFQLQSKVCLGWHITLCILYSQLYVCMYIYISDCSTG